MLQDCLIVWSAQIFSYVRWERLSVHALDIGVVLRASFGVTLLDRRAIHCRFKVAQVLCHGSMLKGVLFVDMVLHRFRDGGQGLKSHSSVQDPQLLSK